MLQLVVNSIRSQMEHEPVLFPGILPHIYLLVWVCGRCLHSCKSRFNIYSLISKAMKQAPSLNAIICDVGWRLLQVTWGRYLVPGMIHLCRCGLCLELRAVGFLFPANSQCLIQDYLPLMKEPICQLSLKLLIGCFYLRSCAMGYALLRFI